MPIPEIVENVETALDVEALDAGRERGLLGAAVLGLLIALGTFVLVAFAPDGGLNASSLQQGLAIAAVMASVPVAVIVRPGNPSRVVSLGGAMTVAGLSTMIGGNLVALLMTVSGLVILVVGVPQRPSISWGLVGRLLGYAVLLSLGMWLSLGNTTSLLMLIAVLLATIIATSSLWDMQRAS